MPGVMVDRKLTYASTLSHVKATVDGTDCQIEEPTPFTPVRYSHKFKGSGIRYELALSLFDDKIVSVTGPYPCGKYPDMTISRSFLLKQLDDGEKVIADKGCRGEPRHVILPDQGSNFQQEFI